MLSMLKAKSESDIVRYVYIVTKFEGVLVNHWKVMAVFRFHAKCLNMLEFIWTYASRKPNTVEPLWSGQLLFGGQPSVPKTMSATYNVIKTSIQRPPLLI